MPASATSLKFRIRHGTLGNILKVFLCVCAVLVTFTYLSGNNKSVSRENSENKLYNGENNHENFERKYNDVQKEEHKADDDENKFELSFGQTLWKDENMKDLFQDFKNRIAVFGNYGGMRLAHQFAVYTVLRIRQPKYVIESGVWKGATTKVIRKILPEAHIISIDPMCVDKNSSNHEVYCGNSFKDFKELGARWTTLNKEETVILFDDHQSGFLRTLQALEFGFKYMMIEDNYAYGSGDNYSPKQLLTRVNIDQIPFLDNFGKQKIIISKAEHDANRQLFKQAVKSYAEFPPLQKMKTVEWQYQNLKNKDDFSIKTMSQIIPDGLGIDVPFDIEYLHYRNMCYLELNELTPAIKALITSIKVPK